MQTIYPDPMPAVPGERNFNYLHQKRATALLVEDSPVNQKIASSMLKRLGFNVQIANDGLEALRAIALNRFAFILMDCQMPNMDGLSATIAIRDSEKRTGKRVPIIAFTATTAPEDCLAAGMDCFIAKTTTIEELANAIRSCVSNEWRRNGHLLEAQSGWKPEREFSLNLQKAQLCS